MNKIAEMIKLKEQLEGVNEAVLAKVPGADSQVLYFISDLMTCAACTEDEYEVVRSTFRAGYCWHFAHMLKNTFGRGEVCWAAPFAHFVWVDENGIPYDAEGVNDGEQAYNIPEEYVDDMLDDFRHIPGRDCNAPKERILGAIRAYEDDGGLEHKDLSYYGFPELSEEKPSLRAREVNFHASGTVTTFRYLVVAESRQKAETLFTEHVSELPRIGYFWKSAMRSAKVYGAGGYVSWKDVGPADRPEGVYELKPYRHGEASDHLND